MKKILQIAIDGPASSGKSTVAKRLAEKLNILYLDTGAMYRAMTVDYLRDPYDFEDEKAVRERFDLLNLQVEMKNNQTRVILKGEDVTELLRSVEVTQNVSKIAASLYIRKALVSMQQSIAKEQSVIMDGRDITTVVLPDATHKFFITADARIRAKRRYHENNILGMTEQTLEEILEDIQKRDQYDSTRDVTPLAKSDDTLLIDTSELTIDQVVDLILNRL